MRSSETGAESGEQLQISRLFEIIYLLLDRGVVTARELSERFEVSQRTIYRDIEMLSSAGIPVYMMKGRNGGIRLLPDFVLDKTILTQSEREEILSALGSLSAVAVSPSSSGGALPKLGALFGASGGSWLEVDFSGWGWGDELKEKFERVKAAVLKHQVLTFTYSSGPAAGSAGGEKTCREAEPLKLVFRGQAWYLYAWCRTRGDYRFFKLSRMENVTATGGVFDRRAPDRVLGQEPNMKTPDMIDVRFRADEAVSFRIFDEYPYSSIRTEPGGSLLISTCMPRGEWLVSYFLTYGQLIEILEPEELRLEIQGVLQSALDRYHKN